MTAIEAIDRTDHLRPNTIELGVKVEWLNQIDGIIQKEIIETHEGATEFTPYVETELERSLIVSAPYDDIYIKWLESRIDYAYGEIAKYNNSMTEFRDAYTNFNNYYNRTKKPLTTAVHYF